MYQSSTHGPTAQSAVTTYTVKAETYSIDLFVSMLLEDIEDLLDVFEIVYSRLILAFLSEGHRSEEVIVGVST